MFLPYIRPIYPEFLTRFVQQPLPAFKDQGPLSVTRVCGRFWFEFLRVMVRVGCRRGTSDAMSRIRHPRLISTSWCRNGLKYFLAVIDKNDHLHVALRDINGREQANDSQLPTKSRLRDAKRCPTLINQRSPRRARYALKHCLYTRKTVKEVLRATAPPASTALTTPRPPSASAYVYYRRR